MPDITPFEYDHETFTAYCGAAVTGGRFVSISGPRTGELYTVGPAPAGDPILGVAARDKAMGQNVMVFRRGGGHTLPVTADGAINAGDQVEVGANGKAKALAAGQAVGYALDDAADGTDARIFLY